MSEVNCHILYIHEHYIPMLTTLVLYIMCPVAQRDIYIVMTYPTGYQEMM